MPIIDNQNKEKSIKHLKDVIERALSEAKDFIIFDRLFFTHIFRTKSSIKEFKEIENLVKNKAFLAFLMIDESNIPERIANARIHRGKEWDEYVSKKGNMKKSTNITSINKGFYLIFLKRQTLIIRFTTLQL